MRFLDRFIARARSAPPGAPVATPKSFELLAPMWQRDAATAPPAQTADAWRTNGDDRLPAEPAHPSPRSSPPPAARERPTSEENAAPVPVTKEPIPPAGDHRTPRRGQGSPAPDSGVQRPTQQAIPVAPAGLHPGLDDPRPQPPASIMRSETPPLDPRPRAVHEQKPGLTPVEIPAAQAPGEVGGPAAVEAREREVSPLPVPAQPSAEEADVNPRPQPLPRAVAHAHAPVPQPLRGPLAPHARAEQGEVSIGRIDVVVVEPEGSQARRPAGLSRDPGSIARSSASRRYLRGL